MRVSKRQLLRIIREEAEAAEEAQPTDDDAAAASDDTEEEPDAKTEAAIRRRIRTALLSESRGAGLFGAIGFHGLGQTSKPDHARAYHGTYDKSKKSRVVKEAAPASADPKRVLYDVVLPALEQSGFSGLEAFKMVRAVAEAMEADLKGMFG